MTLETSIHTYVNTPEHKHMCVSTQRGGGREGRRGRERKIKKERKREKGKKEGERGRGRK